MTEQNVDQTKLLQALYQDYLTETIQLKEQNAALRLRIQELEASQEVEQDATDSEAA